MCQKTHTLRQYILGGIDITVMHCSALRASPEPDTQVFDSFVLITAATASLAGGEEPVYDDEFLPIPACFVSKLPANFAPCGICNMERKFMIPHHVFGGQVFYTNDVVAPHKLGCHFMDCILPLIGNALMQPCHLNACLLSVATPLWLSGELPL